MKNAKVKTVEGYQVDKNFRKMKSDLGRGTIYKRNYVPLYCVETALWLAECSWQTCKLFFLARSALRYRSYEEPNRAPNMLKNVWQLSHFST